MNAIVPRGCTKRLAAEGFRVLKLQQSGVSIWSSNCLSVCRERLMFVHAFREGVNVRLFYGRTRSKHVINT